MKSIPILLAALTINAYAQINGFQSFIRQTQQPETIEKKVAKRLLTPPHKKSLRLTLKGDTVLCM